MFHSKALTNTRIACVVGRLDTGSSVLQLSVDPFGDQEINGERFWKSLSKGMANAIFRAEFKRAVDVKNWPLLADVNGCGPAFNEEEVNRLKLGQQMM